MHTRAHANPTAPPVASVMAGAVSRYAHIGSLYTFPTATYADRISSYSHVVATSANATASYSRSVAPYASTVAPYSILIATYSHATAIYSFFGYTLRTAYCGQFRGIRGRPHNRTQRQPFTVRLLTLGAVATHGRDGKGSRNR